MDSGGVNANRHHKEACSMIMIDCDFPGGNIITERIDGDDVFVRQDLRDTDRDWFYWYFRVRGAAGRTVRFHFTGSNVIGTRGPGMSEDGGVTWRWLGNDAVDGQSFVYAFANDADDVRFSFGMPYVQADLDRFLASYVDSDYLVAETLCETHKGRDVEMLYVGRLDGGADLRVLIAARHHCCEMMQSYVLEGIMAAILGEDDLGRWFQGRVECLVIPFVDKDGVEDGDQGKNRKPRDHNRDYVGESVHIETAVMRERVPDWSAGKLKVAIDLHCPWIRSNRNETIYLVGSESEAPWQEQIRFSHILEAERTGGLPFCAADNLPFGVEWNTAENYAAGKSFGRWAGELPGVQLATAIEFPYANVGDLDTSPELARAFGRDLATALKVYLETMV